MGHLAGFGDQALAALDARFVLEMLVEQGGDAQAGGVRVDVDEGDAVVHQLREAGGFLLPFGDHGQALGEIRRKGRVVGGGAPGPTLVSVVVIGGGDQNGVAEHPGQRRRVAVPVGADFERQARRC